MNKTKETKIKQKLFSIFGAWVENEIDLYKQGRPSIYDRISEDTPVEDLLQIFEILIMHWSGA